MKQNIYLTQCSEKRRLLFGRRLSGLVGSGVNCRIGGVISLCLRGATRNLFWCSVAWRGCLFVYAESENISRDWCFLILFTHYIHAYIYTQRSIYDCFFYDSASSVALFLNAVAFRKSLEHYEGFPHCFRAGTHFVQRLPSYVAFDRCQAIER